MSKICFIGDCHLGFRHRMKVQRLKDYTTSFLEALALAELSGPAAIVFTGDVFHHVRPDPKTMHTLITRVLELAREIPLIFCIGNHDIETHLGSSYIPIISELHENIYVLTTQKHQVILNIEGKKVGFYGFQCAAVVHWVDCGAELPREADRLHRQKNSPRKPLKQ